MAQSQRNTLVPIVLIGLGILFLIGQIFNINLWSMLGFSWPMFIVIPGVIFLTIAATGSKKTLGFIFPGTIITGTGAILSYQTITHNWQSWAYIWTLYPAFVGLGLMFVGWRMEDQKQYGIGQAMVNYSVIAFLLGAAFFELFIFHSNGALTGWIFPLALIAFGGFLLIGRSGSDHEKRKFSDVPFARTHGRLSYGDRLQQRIDEAIAEDEPVEPMQ